MLASNGWYPWSKKRAADDNVRFSDVAIAAFRQYLKLPKEESTNVKKKTGFITIFANIDNKGATWRPYRRTVSLPDSNF
jgi:hypothetical protein